MTSFSCLTSKVKRECCDLADAMLCAMLSPCCLNSYAKHHQGIHLRVAGYMLNRKVEDTDHLGKTMGGGQDPDLFQVGLHQSKLQDSKVAETPHQLSHNTCFNGTDVLLCCEFLAIGFQSHHAALIQVPRDPKHKEKYQMHQNLMCKGYLHLFFFFSPGLWSAHIHYVGIQ